MTGCREEMSLALLKALKEHGFSVDKRTRDKVRAGIIASIRNIASINKNNENRKDRRDCMSCARGNSRPKWSRSRSSAPPGRKNLKELGSQKNGWEQNSNTQRASLARSMSKSRTEGSGRKDQDVLP